MDIFGDIEYAVYVYMFLLFIVNIVLLYKVIKWYYVHQYNNLSALENKQLYMFFCWLEEVYILFYIIPSSVQIWIGTQILGDIGYPILSNNYRDLLIALLTVLSITTAISLICINFEKNIENKLNFNQPLSTAYTNEYIRDILFTIKTFSSGYKHLWISSFLIVYTIWLLFELTDNSLYYPEIHYSLLWQLYLVSGLSFIKTLIEFSFLSRTI